MNTKYTLLTISLLIFSTSLTVAQYQYNWSVSNSNVYPGERVIAIIDAGSIGTYDGIGIIGEVVDDNGNWGQALPKRSDFQMHLKFSNGMSYEIVQERETLNIVLRLRQISDRIFHLTANIPNQHKSVSVSFDVVISAGIESFTLGSTTTINDLGDLVIPQPTYESSFSGKVIVDTIESTGKASISGLDLNGARNPNASSLGLNLSASNYTNIHITHDTWSGSHGLLFNSYQPISNPSGGLSVLGNTKYANDEGSYSGGAGSIMYFGNGGNMGFYISPTSTGKDDDVIWGEPKLWLKRNGNVGIGTTTPSHKLSVAGTINSEEIIVEENVGADFVFEASYDLPSLQDIEAFIEQNQHLPGIAPASQMIEEGIKVGELQMQLLQKIEELTLYVIEINKENKALVQTNHQLEQRMKQDTQQNESLMMLIKSLSQRIKQLEEHEN